MPLFYAVLVRLSPGYSPLIGRLHTRYSPVRRSPPKYCYFYAAPRLACVKPVASVHPEPGSNSSLYNLFVLISLAQNSLFFISLQLTVLILILYVQENHHWSSHSCTTFCWYVNLSKNSCLLHFQPFWSGVKAGAKIRLFILNHQMFSEVFFKKVSGHLNVAAGFLLSLANLTLCYPFKFPHHVAVPFSLECGCKSSALQHTLQTFCKLFLQGF